MNRYWISWWTSDSLKKCTFAWWITGYCADGEHQQLSVCAVIDASSEEEAWSIVSKYCDYEERFCEQKDNDFMPNPERFR